MTDTHTRAVALIATVKNALASGVKHFDAAGNPLTTVKEVLEALRRDGRIEMQGPE